MDPIYIPRLTKLPEHTEVVDFKEFLPNLPTLTPVQGQLKVSHKGNYLEVTAKADAIATLTCHRCLQQYNHRLVINVSELIWLDDTADSSSLPLERELLPEDLIETLSPEGYFDATAWLYEQFCLEIPQRQLCDTECVGVSIAEPADSTAPSPDRRWAALEALKRQLPS